jgi:dihydrofolate reductase
MNTPHPIAPRISLIAAVAHGGVIGNGHAMPWHLPEDLAHFRRVTLGHTVVMGRRTWDSLPPRFRPLPGRRNIVLSRQPGWQAPGAEVAHSLDAALALARGEARLFVIGGGALYAAALPLADELWLTEIDAAFDGSVHFPDWPREAFHCVQATPVQAAPPNTFALAFKHYRRR